MQFAPGASCMPQFVASVTPREGFQGNVGKPSFFSVVGAMAMLRQSHYAFGKLSP